MYYPRSRRRSAQDSILDDRRVRGQPDGNTVFDTTRNLPTKTSEDIYFSTFSLHNAFWIPLEDFPWHQRGGTMPCIVNDGCGCDHYLISASECCCSFIGLILPACDYQYQLGSPLSVHTAVWTNYLRCSAIIRYFWPPVLRSACVL